MKYFYKLAAPLLAVALFFTASTPGNVALATEAEARLYKEIQSNSWENWPDGPQVSAESAIVMEASTGTILYAKSIDEQHYPASITKIMTVLLALENLDMDEEVVFSYNAVHSIPYDSSHIARDVGEILTVEQCLYAILLESANECSNAIAEQVSGSIEAFADLMNERAAELGCTNTHFANPHGLPDENHYTSAHDMALITQAAISYPEFRQISGTARYILPATNKKSEELPMSNHHHMISMNRTSKYLDDTVFAGKTGYTSVALNTLVTCATRNGMDLIVVTMKTQGTGQTGVPTFSDTANLLNYAGENFHKVNISQNETNFTIGQSELFNTGSTIFGNSTPMIEMDKNGYIVLPTTAEFADASPKLEFVEDKDSSVIATLSYSYADQVVGSADLLFSKNALQEFEFQETNVAVDETQSQDLTLEIGNSETTNVLGETSTQPKLIKINLRVLAIVVGAFLGIIILMLLIRKFLIDFHVDLRFLRRFKKKRKRYDKNSFADENRRKYRRRKRRRKF